MGAGCLNAALKRRTFGREFRGKAAEVDVERLEVPLRER